jgi:hypothetical protein
VNTGESEIGSLKHSSTVDDFIVGYNLLEAEGERVRVS